MPVASQDDPAVARQPAACDYALPVALLLAAVSLLFSRGAPAPANLAAVRVGIGGHPSSVTRR
jgi:hypothetical protein